MKPTRFGRILIYATESKPRCCDPDGAERTQLVGEAASQQTKSLSVEGSPCICDGARSFPCQCRSQAEANRQRGLKLR